MKTGKETIVGVHSGTMKTVGAEILRDECRGLLDDLDDDGIVITRDGNPIAKILPCKVPTSGSLIGSWKGKVTISGDLLSTGERWDAES